MNLRYRNSWEETQLVETRLWRDDKESQEAAGKSAEEGASQQGERGACQGKSRIGESQGRTKEIRVKCFQGLVKPN